MGMWPQWTGLRGPEGHSQGASGAWRSCGARQCLRCLLLFGVRVGFRSSWPCLSPMTVTQQLFLFQVALEPPYRL